MKIGIDIDEVLVKSVENVLDIFNKENNLSFNYENITSYHLSKALGVGKEGSLKLWEQYWHSDVFDKKLVEGAVDSVDKLSKNHELFFITSRSKGLHEKNERLLNSNFSNISPEILYSTEHQRIKEKTKLEICKDLGVNIMIDDTEDVANYFVGEKIKLLLFDKPWNKKFPDNKHPNIIRVMGWKDALLKIQEMKK